MLVRDALVIVLTGIVLGVSFNILGLASRPSRGMPWIGAARSLESVESVAEPARGPAPVAMPANDPAAAPPAIRRTEVAKNTATPEPTAATPAPSRADAESASTSVAPSPGPGLRAALPVIPDLGRPLKVELPTVEKFVEAAAALIVDAREREAFAAGHLPGAVSVPYDEVAGDPSRLAALDARGRPIIVYCSGGACEQSLMLADLMVRDHGMRRVLVYEGGFAEWSASGNPVARVVE